MKVYLHYNEGDDENLHMTVKLTLPKSWRTGEVERLKDVMQDSYNKKHPNNEICHPEMHFEKADGTILADDATVEKFVKDKEDLFLKMGDGQTMEELGITEPEDPLPATSSDKTKEIERVVKPPPATTAAPIAAKKADPSLLVCKHFGCSKRYKEEDNHDTHCQYHEKPPVFHETRKFWACCPKKIAYDWETFTAIPGCKVGRCTNEDPTKKFLGGSDMRAEQAKKYEYAPKKIGGSQPSPQQPRTALSDLSDLRKALVNVGVPGKTFDAARDHLKTKHEELGAKVWEEVSKEIGQQISSILEQVVSEE